jgi:hypothetical protein
MTFELEAWHVISLTVTFLGASAAAGKLLLAQAQRHMDDRFAAQEKARAANHEQLSMRLDRLEQAAHDESGNWARLERELHEMKAELPLNYVRREDYLRGQSVVEAKLDGLATKLDNVQLRAMLGNREGL